MFSTVYVLMVNNKVEEVFENYKDAFNYFIFLYNYLCLEKFTPEEECFLDTYYSDHPDELGSIGFFCTGSEGNLFRIIPTTLWHEEQ